MIFSFSPIYLSKPLKRALFSCLVLSFLMAGGCSSVGDILGQKKPAAQTQKATQFQPVPKAAASAQTGVNAGMAPSRLQNQPWPSGAGQSLPSNSNAGMYPQKTASYKPAPPPLPAYEQPKNGKTQVAILLPLSGKNAGLGQAMLNAAQLAVFDMAGGNFELMPRDTGANADSAVLAARDAIASGAQLLIGPLFAADVAAIKPVVQTSNVNMLALSTDVSLAEPGVYVMGFAPAPQVERVVAFASRKGAQRFAALIPSGAYGQLVQQAFESAVHDQHGTIAAMESVSKIQELVAKRDQIDALLLPFGGNELKQIASQLASGGFDSAKVRFLGTGLWDEPGLGSNSPLLVGGWFAAAEPEAREAFNKNFVKTYGQEPPRLATLAYDATALAAVLAQRGGHFDRTALSNPSGFAGLDGVFRLTPQGLAERGLAINEVTPSGSKVADPAPYSFEKGVY